jgi:glycosyltransferase involved in cell wall biosynthesis
LVQDFVPDIIHLHEPLIAGICGLKAARQLNIPVIVTLHQLPWFVTKYMESSPIRIEWLLWQYGKWFLSHCAASIVPMRHIAAVVSRHANHQPCVIPYGANLRRFQANEDSDGEDDCLRQRYSLPVNKPIILHTGRLDKDKGVNYVIQAAAKVMQKVDAELLIVGDGCQRHSLIRQSQELGIGDRCHFTGFLSPDGELAATYQLADIFVSASEIETFGIVILEAMAAARPVVAVKATCIPDLVDNNRSGLLVRPKDVDGLAKKMIWLLENPGQARAMGREGQRISQKYDQDTMLRKHLQLYQSILQSNRKTNPIKSFGVQSCGQT